jgi:hypothetical protein
MELPEHCQCDDDAEAPSKSDLLALLRQPCGLDDAPTTEAKAVILFLHYTAYVVHATGYWLLQEIKSAGASTDDLGFPSFKNEAPGLRIWEGTFGWESSDIEPDIIAQGTIREPTEEEWAAIRKGVCPW